MPAFLKSVDFAITKHAGEPCPHLQRNARCDIHEHLRQRGFRGCAVYDCFGAGQQVVQVTFGGGVDWRESPRTATRMFAAFEVMRRLHELLWYLAEASELGPAREIAAALTETERLTHLDADALIALDLPGHARTIDALLTRASDRVRPQQAPSHEGADLTAKDLRRADLRGTNLRDALLIATNLAGADLRLTDLRGADLRDANLRGADLSRSLFLTRPQLDSARTNAATQLPPSLIEPKS